MIQSTGIIGVTSKVSADIATDDSQERFPSHRPVRRERPRQSKLRLEPFQGLVHLILGRSYAAAVSVAGEVTRDSFAA